MIPTITSKEDALSMLADLEKHLTSKLHLYPDEHLLTQYRARTENLLKTITGHLYADLTRITRTPEELLDVIRIGLWITTASPPAQSRIHALIKNDHYCHNATDGTSATLRCISYASPSIDELTELATQLPSLLSSPMTPKDVHENS